MGRCGLYYFTTKLRKTIVKHVLETDWPNKYPLFNEETQARGSKTKRKVTLNGKK